jgi:hypothetical protein
MEGSGLGRAEVLSRHLSGEIKAHHENLRIAGVPVEIRTSHLPDKSPELYHYTACSVHSCC